MNNNKEHYRQFSKTETSIPVFSRDWWLDAVCGEKNWDVALVNTGRRVIGTMPFYIKKRVGFTLLTQPPLTQTLGPWIRPSNAKYAKTLGYQKKVLNALIEQLPSFDYLSQNWHYSNINWKPFYWRGFKQTTYYTYVLHDLVNESQLWNGFEEKVKTDIKKAENRFKLRIRDDLGVGAVLTLNRKSFDRNEMEFPFTEELVLKVDRACGERNCCKVLIAEDEDGRHHAGAYIVWDENSAYYLMGGGDPDLRNSGAASLVLWTAIRHASTVTNKFDFEGTMAEPIDRFFRGFGGQQQLYFNISKTNSILLQIRESLLSLTGR